VAILMEPVAPWLRELNRLFTTETGPSAFVPPADVLIAQDAVTVHMDVPGLRADNLEIELENDTLSVRGERPYPYDDAAEGVWRRIERGFGRFERSLRVPGGLDPGQVEASLADGVLTINVPRPQAPQPRRIPIGGGERSETAEQQQTTA
jgi:HSP20 family protein